MQLVHLFLADAVWIAFVLMSAAVLAETSETENLSFDGETAKNLQ
jgi:hypothetical protein